MPLPDFRNALARCYAILLLVALPASAQIGGPATPDPAAILVAAKAASGGAAWDALRTQHSRVDIHAGGLAGKAERWSEYPTGRSQLAYTLGPISGAAGFDGNVAWVQDASGAVNIETAEVARQLAVNSAYRDRLAFWYPERAAARFFYKERVNADGADFHVIRVTPEGGRPFELWINTETQLIERLVEREAIETRTETYMDLRDVQGVLVPFRVRASRGDARQDEVIVVESMAFNEPVTGVRFAPPPPPAPDFVFPAGKRIAEVPFDVHDGHLFLKVMLNGKGPFRMLLDSGGGNVLSPAVARRIGSVDASDAAGGEAPQNVGLARVERVEIGGVVLLRQPFATIDLDDFTRRVEGLTDVAGIIGYELFKRLPVTLDFAQSRAVFHDPARFEPPAAGVKLPITFRGTIPVVKGRVDDVAGLFAIDTGSRGSLTLALPFVEANDLVAKYAPKVDAIYGASVGGRVRALVTRAKILELGGLVVRDPVTSLAQQRSGGTADADLAGNIGYGVLRQFNITFDYPHSALYLEKNANFGRPDAYDRAGMWIERANSGYEVIDVVAGGPAAAAGIQAGDVIVAIDGKPWTALPLSALRTELRASPGKKIRLKMSGRAERVVTLRDLV